MRVLIAVSSLIGGGAEHVARKNLELLLDCLNIEVGAFVCSRNTTEQYDIPFFCAEDVGLKNPLKLLFGSTSLYRFYMACLVDFAPDVIHVHNYILFSPSFIKALRDYRRSKQCKIIMTHHTYSYICANDALYNHSRMALCEQCTGKFDNTILQKNCAGSYPKSIAKYLQKKQFQKYFAGNWIDLHISPSDFLKQKLRRVFPSAPLEMIYNPCIEAIMDITPAAERKDEIVYFGRISKEKNLYSLIQRMQSTPVHCKIIIIGTGPDLGRIKILAEKSQNVCIVDRFLPTKELYKRISNAKYFILPSVWYENSPVSIIEAINIGLIPLVSNIGGMQELINIFGVGYTFDPCKIETLLQKMDQIEENYQKDFKALLNARQGLEQFMVKKYKSQILRIYQ